MRKPLLCLLMLFFSISIIYGDYIVNFEGTNETKLLTPQVKCNFSCLSWDSTEALIGTLESDWKNGTRSTGCVVTEPQSL